MMRYLFVVFLILYEKSDIKLRESEVQEEFFLLETGEGGETAEPTFSVPSPRISSVSLSVAGSASQGPELKYKDIMEYQM